MKALWKVPFCLSLWNILIYSNCAKVTNADQLKTSLRNGFGQTGNLIGHGEGFSVQGNDNEEAAPGGPDHGTDAALGDTRVSGADAAVAAAAAAAAKTCPGSVQGCKGETGCTHEKATSAVSHSTCTKEKCEHESADCTAKNPKDECDTCKKYVGNPCPGEDNKGCKGNSCTLCGGCCCVVCPGKGGKQCPGKECATCSGKGYVVCKGENGSSECKGEGCETCKGKRCVECPGKDKNPCPGKECTVCAGKGCIKCPGENNVECPLKGCEVCSENGFIECTETDKTKCPRTEPIKCPKAEGVNCTNADCDVCKRRTITATSVTDQAPAIESTTPVVSQQTVAVQSGPPPDPNSLQEVNTSEKDKDVSSKEEEVLVEKGVEDDAQDGGHDDDTGEGGETDSANQDDVSLEYDDEEVEEENEDAEYSQQITETQNGKSNSPTVGLESLISDATVHDALAEQCKDNVQGKKEAEAFVNTLLDLLDGSNSAADNAIKNLADDISQFLLK
ncbi:hypothetical protein PVIIG_04710 [Plasmodium vivax India VII]|uniref:Merozoite surface protein (SPAM) n=1 Tax=Plasmodium vivax India VII TaxID=1077284 RepID=A0A0J9SG40_PLAVI|nr:hypothetical protein PVIIG_04710 [Plasmodium vivax India VII]